MPECSKCQRDVPKVGFSQSQLKKRADQRVCKGCNSSSNLKKQSEMSSSMHSVASVSTVDPTVAVQIVDTTANHLNNLEQMMTGFQSSFHALQVKYKRLQEERDQLKEQVASLQKRLDEKEAATAAVSIKPEKAKQKEDSPNNKSQLQKQKTEKKNSSIASSPPPPPPPLVEKEMKEESKERSVQDQKQPEKKKEEDEDEWHTVVRRKHHR